LFCLACLPLIEADLPAVLALDQRCLGGLWTRGGYQREIDSPNSDLYVLVSCPNGDILRQRQAGEPIATADPAAVDCIDLSHVADLRRSPLTLLGVGCLWAILEEAHITTLAIEPSYQGHKLGQLLLSQLLLSARQRGLTHATLEVRVSNERALKLYQKFGFKSAGERKRYYANGENALILWRSGLQSDEALTQFLALQKAAIEHLADQQSCCFLR
jgi:[ribosomal protein S18]-alanine N-acetyltransferase